MKMCEDVHVAEILEMPLSSRKPLEILNHSNGKVTLIQSTRMQRFLKTI